MRRFESSETLFVGLPDFHMPSAVVVIVMVSVEATLYWLGVFYARHTGCGSIARSIPSFSDCHPYKYL